MNHAGDDDHVSGGQSWRRRNISPLMTHGWIQTPQLVAAPWDIRPHGAGVTEGDGD